MNRNLGFCILVAASLLLVIGCDSGGSDSDVYAIGDTGPAGGLVFYIDEADEYDWTYLEVAPASTEWASKAWGDQGTVIGGDTALTGIGAGQAATDAIVAHMEGEAITDTAAQVCDALELEHDGTTFDDWFLPSLGELNAVWDNLVDDGTGANNGVGGFADNYYWSSSEDNNLYTSLYSFNNGVPAIGDKDSLQRVRAVRAF